MVGLQEIDARWPARQGPPCAQLLDGVLIAWELAAYDALAQQLANTPSPNLELAITYPNLDAHLSYTYLVPSLSLSYPWLLPDQDVAGTGPGRHSSKDL